jgi:hypothetical protein
MRRCALRVPSGAAVLAGLLSCAAGLSAWADTISFTHEDFTLTPVFNNVTSFSFSIDVAGTLAPGAYVNPTLNGVQYAVVGVLTDDTPSGFPGFNLQRTIGGAEFYAQGSSLEFVIAAGANLADGVQITEFVSFTFNGREVDTGRYHPALLAFSQDGSGSIRNSNNFGGINVTTNQLVDVDFGEEYIVDLAFVPTLVPVPVPAVGWVLWPMLGLLGWMRRRR